MGVRTSVIAGKTDSAEDFRLSSLGLWVPASQINVRTGVTSVPVLTGTGNWTCTIGPFSCVVDGTSNSLQGGYWATLDTATTVTLNTANTQARIDLISLQIQDNAYDGSGVNAGRILYTAGTPGSGSAPAAPANSISLFTVPVAANATSANFAGATAVFPFTAAAGGIVPARSASDKPAVVSGVQYRHRLDMTATSGAVTPLESSTDGVTWTPVFNPSGLFGAWTTLGYGASFSAGYVGGSGPNAQYRTASGGRIELYGGGSSGGSAVANGSQILTGLPAPSGDRLLTPANSSGMIIKIASGATVATIVVSGTFPASSNFSIDGLSYVP